MYLKLYTLIQNQSIQILINITDLANINISIYKLQKVQNLVIRKLQETMQSNIPLVLIIPGQAPITNFNCDNDIYHVDIANPGQVPSMCLSLTQTLPQNYAIGVYFAQPPYTQLQYLGAISNNRPSDIFQTGFPLRTDLAQIQTIKICLKGQHFNQLQDLVLAEDGKKQYSKLVAQNLYNFMMSYNKDGLLQHGIQGDYLVIPSSFLGKWLQKFQQKYAKDPNFILKTTTN